MFQAEFYDGLSARAKSVWVEVRGDRLQINIEGEPLSYTLAEMEVQAKLGATKRIIDLPDSARLEATDISEVEAAMPSPSAGFWRALHYLENNLGWVLISLVATVFAGWMFLQHGVPKLAEYVAKVTPPSMEARLGEQVLKGLDHKYGYFSPSKTNKARQTKIASALDQLCDVNTCPQYQLNFRDGGIIGANALALPGGIMVITDGLVELAKDDNEIVAVLAHELGHVKQRHAFRQSIQGTLSGLVLAAVTGDVSSLGSGLPAVLMQMRYSRQHELEADGFALAALQKSCLPPRAFADILFRLQNQPLERGDKKTKNKTKKENPAEAYDPISDMLSTHPNTIERIKPFVEAKQHC
ncbi:MAG: M48 family metallopeptidase [Methylophilaceae bacterium]